MIDVSGLEMPELIEQMMVPSFYPHPVESVRLIRTHISWILLAGEFAYKVKKPVDLGFLNFSTLERRRFFCDEEIRLNQRGAPGLYLEVVSLTRSGSGGFRINGGGPAVEYAVKMRRFPDGALLSEALRAGRLGEAEIAGLARCIAEYHVAAPRAPQSFGQPGAIRASIDDNYRHTERFVHVGGPQFPDQMRATRAFTDRFIETRSELLANRVGADRIRECHGDLHLGNICRWPEAGGLLLFDCIEFNDSFRYVDVMYDVGFTAMDLRANGRPDLANVFVNTYAETSGDWGAMRVLPLYLCRQAYVRAKVNSLIWADPGGSIDTRDEAFAEAVRYFTLAWEYTRPKVGRLILMCGPSASGKSTIARGVAGRLDALHVRSDAVRKHLAAMPLRARGGAALYSAEMNQKTYAQLQEWGTILAGEGNTVIIDGTYLQQESRASIARATRAAGVRIDIVYCTAPLSILRERLIHRTGDITDATPEILLEQIAKFEPFSETERDILLTVDTTRPSELTIQQVIAHLAVKHVGGS